MHFVFSRHMLWTLAILTVLVVVYYQYENWNGARELREARRKLAERAGTDNFMDLVPAEIPAEENFFAIPLIAGWRNAGPSGDDPSYTFPHKKLLPAGVGTPPQIMEEPGCFWMDVEGWARARRAGTKSPPDKPAAKLLLEELGDGGGIIGELIDGLSRPGVQFVPSLRRRIAAGHGNPNLAVLPGTKDSVPFQRALGIHLRASALAGDGGRVKSLTGVMLRLVKVWSGEPGMIGAIIGLAQNKVTLEALNEALSCPGLRAEEFKQMEEWLVEENELEVLERAFLFQAFAEDRMIEWSRSLQSNWKEHLHLPVSGFEEIWMMSKMLALGPSGWWDTNRAFAVEMITGYCGTKGEDWWRSGKSAPATDSAKVLDAGILFSVGKTKVPNPRRYLGSVTVGSIGDVWDRAVSNLIQRRCAILTCALHRHRLAHGAFPATLAPLAAAPPKDPEKSAVPLRYRRAEKGFVLWSVGRDGEDNGGDPVKDVVWRHGR